MDQTFLNFYKEELFYIRKSAEEFAKKHPVIASRLQIEPDRSKDPHTERLIQAFSFLTARIRKKIHDDFPEITESFFNIVYPHYINPIPSMCVTVFNPAEKNLDEKGYRIEKGTKLYSRIATEDSVSCSFRTCYPTTLWPVKIVKAKLTDPKNLTIKDVQKAVVIELKTFNDSMRFSELEWDSVRFFLSGQPHYIYELYELLMNHVCQIEVESANEFGDIESLTLSQDSIKPVGFEPDEEMIPYPNRSFLGYRILFEYFCFPEKFLFFDLHGLNQLRQKDMGDTLELWFYLNKIPKKTVKIDNETFRLNAAPAVNLFTKVAEPIRVDRKKTEYHLIPDIRRRESTEIFSVDKVSATPEDRNRKEIEYQPYYSIKHFQSAQNNGHTSPFWLMNRRDSEKKDDNGTEVFLSFTDSHLNPTTPMVDIVTVRTTCTNRDIPFYLPFNADEHGDFDIEAPGAPIQSIRCLIRPTMTRRLALGGALQWRLMSHLSLNYLSLLDNNGQALREILKLYDYDESASTIQQIEGIVKIKHEYVLRQINYSYIRGLQVTIEFDENKYVGSGLFLFASVLERFLSQYVSVNSFIEMVAKTTQHPDTIIKTWKPQSGNQIIL